MQRLAIISDTHLPKAGRRLPTACMDELQGADLIVHAGDFSQVAVLRELQRYGKVLAVHGNADDEELRRLLPRCAEVELAGGRRLAVVHDAGPARGRLARLRRWFPGADAVIFGHSHIPLHERADDGFQILNPGSPTERRRSPHHTIGVATVGDAAVRLGARPAPAAKELRFRLIVLD